MDEKSRCVYTCLFGNYEDLNEQDVVRESNVDFLCFTDNPTLKSNTWKIIHVSPLFPFDLARSSKLYKICPHRMLSEYSASIYMDNSVILRKKPESIFDDLLPADKNISLFLHSFRETVIDEFNEVINLQLDDLNTVLEQLNAYSLTKPNVLVEKPHWCGFILRKHMDREVVNVMETWFSHILRYSRRDQLSINYVLSDMNYDVNEIQMDNQGSEYHNWPVSINRTRIDYIQNGQFSTTSLQLLNRRIEKEIRDLSEQAFRKSNDYSLDIHQISNQEIIELLGTVKEANMDQNSLAALLFQNIHLHMELKEVRQELLKYMNSRSWRITRPLRKIAQIIKGKTE